MDQLFDLSEIWPVIYSFQPDQWADLAKMQRCRNAQANTVGNE